MLASWQLWFPPHSGDNWPALLGFGIGLVALAWLIRRAAVSSRANADKQCYNARSYKAHQAIDEIAIRQWLDKQRSAVQFVRGGEPSAQQLNFLRRVSSGQRVREVQDG